MKVWAYREQWMDIPESVRDEGNDELSASGASGLEFCDEEMKVVRLLIVL